MNFHLLKTDCARAYKLLYRIQVVAWENLANMISDDPFLGNLACIGIWLVCAPTIVVTAALIPFLCIFRRWNGFVISMADVLESSNVIAQRYLDMQKHLGGRMTIAILAQIFSIVMAFLNMLAGILRSIYDFGKFCWNKTSEGAKWAWSKIKALFS